MKLLVMQLKKMWKIHISWMWYSWVIDCCSYQEFCFRNLLNMHVDYCCTVTASKFWFLSWNIRCLGEVSHIFDQIICLIQNNSCKSLLFMLTSFSFTSFFWRMEQFSAFMFDSNLLANRSTYLCTLKDHSGNT